MLLNFRGISKRDNFSKFIIIAYCSKNDLVTLVLIQGFYWLHAATVKDESLIFGDFGSSILATVW